MLQNPLILFRSGLDDQRVVERVGHDAHGWLAVRQSVPGAALPRQARRFPTIEAAPAGPVAAAGTCAA